MGYSSSALDIDLIWGMVKAVSNAGGDLQTTNVMDVAVVMAMHGNRPRSSRLEGNNLVVWIIAVEYREVEADEDDATCGWRDMIPECLPVTFTIPD